MKRPSFQFYPGDWTTNAKLRRCTHAQRGVWLDVLCLMHDSDTAYGTLQWPLKEIANAAGTTVAVLRELRDKGVLKGAERGEQCAGWIFTPRHAGKLGDPVVLIQPMPGPIWFSSRMVEDEYKSMVRAGHAREFSPIGQPKAEPKATPKGGIGEPPNPGNGDVSSSSSSSSTSVNTGGDIAHTRAGEATQAMRKAGCSSVNPSHPDLIELIAQGVTAQQLADLTAELVAVHGPRPQAYIVKAMRNLVQSRKDTPPTQPKEPAPPRPPIEDA